LPLLVTSSGIDLLFASLFCHGKLDAVAYLNQVMLLKSQPSTGLGKFWDVWNA
jgi:hypothetical protein